MSVWRMLNPFRWSRGVVVVVFSVFFAVGLPLWFSGLSVFASTINPVNAVLKVPDVELITPVTPVEIAGNGLRTPERLAGAYTNGGKVFLFGHSTGVFRNLRWLKEGAEISYGEGQEVEKYVVDKIEMMARGAVNMAQLLKRSDDKELVLMTCAGGRLVDGDYAERLIVYATYVGE